jgi:hypothetical protein
VPNWAKRTLGAFGLLVVSSIAARGGNKKTQDIAAPAAEYAARRTLDGEALFRAAEQDVDDEIDELADAGDELTGGEREAS